MISEKTEIAINLAAKVVSYGTTLLLSFFLTPYLIEKLGSEAYSFYPIANNFTSYMSVITIALNSMASRFITIALTRGEQEKANKYFVSILFGNIIMSAILLIPMVAIVVFLDCILDIPVELVTQVKLLFTLVFISMLVNLLTNVFGVATFAKNKLYLTSISDVIVGIFRVVLYLVLFLLFEPTIVYVGVVALAVAVLTVAFQYVYTKKLLPEMVIGRNNFDWKAIKEVLSSGVWNSINQIGTVLLSTVGLMMCNSLYGASEGGIYSVALTIPTFMNGIVNMLSSVFLPMLTIKYARGNRKEVLDHVSMTQNVIGVIDNVPIAVFMAVGVNFFQLWTPSVDPYRVQIYSILAIGYLLVTSVSWPLSNLNTVMNRVKIPAIVMVATGIANVLLILATYYFTDWGPYTIPLGQMILFILNRGFFVTTYTAKSMGEKWYTFYAPIVRNLIGTGLIYGLSYVVNSFVNPITWISLGIECVVLGIVGLGINCLIVFKPSGMKKAVSFIKGRKKK
jgi:O-antigen/teichoic acid export membrane protein